MLVQDSTSSLLHEFYYPTIQVTKKLLHTLAVKGVSLKHLPRDRQPAGSPKAHTPAPCRSKSIALYQMRAGCLGGSCRTQLVRGVTFPSERNSEGNSFETILNFAIWWNLWHQLHCFLAARQEPGNSRWYTRVNRKLEVATEITLQPLPARDLFSIRK